MAEFLMPSLGADMDQGTLLEWIVKPGDQVHKGEIVAVVDTAKAAVEVECFESGVMGSILVEPGRTVPVGTPLAVITPAGLAVIPAAPAPAEAVVAVVAAPAPVVGLPVPPSARRRVPATPPIRHLARQLGVDISKVHGTGEGGTVTHADVEAAAAATRRRPRVSPYARRLAAELGIDLTVIRGTGADGAIRAVDVRRALSEAKEGAAQAAPAAGKENQQ